MNEQSALPFFNRFVGAFEVRIKTILELPGIDPGTSHMLSERSTTWATAPGDFDVSQN